MSGIDEALSIPPESSVSDFTSSSPRVYSWISDCHGFWYNFLLVVLSFVFVVYLAIKAKRSYVKLSYGSTFIMIYYYVCLWVVTLLNLAWCSARFRHANKILRRY